LAFGSFHVSVGARVPGGLPAFGLARNGIVSTRSPECAINVVRANIDLHVAAALSVAAAALRKIIAMVAARTFLRMFISSPFCYYS
jgi:hypothetical protein